LTNNTATIVTYEYNGSSESLVLAAKVIQNARSSRHTVNSSHEGYGPWKL